MIYCRERLCIKWVLLTSFLEISWLIEWKVISIPAPEQIKKTLFFIKVRTCSLHTRDFSTYIASNPRVTLTKEKKSQKTLKCPKKKYITVILPGDFRELEKQPIANVLHDCSEKLKKISRKASVVVYSFWFY